MRNLYELCENDCLTPESEKVIKPNKISGFDN